MLKSDKDVTDEDFQQPIHSQPIVIKKEEQKKTILASVGGVIGPAVAGAGLGALGLIAGPVWSCGCTCWLLHWNGCGLSWNCHVQ